MFCKNRQRLNTVSYFCKKLHLRSFSGFWIHLRLWSLNMSLFSLLLLPFEINKVEKQSFNLDTNFFLIDTTFFLKDVNSIKEMVNSFHIFSRFSGLRPNLSKCEIAGIGVLKGVKVAVCGIQCVDLVLDTIKILGTHFSYNKKLKEERTWIKIMETTKPYSRRKSTYFWNNF